MRLKHKNNIFDLDITRDGENLTLIEELKSSDFKVAELNNNSYSVTSANGKKLVNFYKDKNHIIVNIDGHNYQFELIEEEDFNDFSSNSDKNVDILKSPMPGSVIKLLVKEGDTVEEGTALIIIEAMKMETTLYSSIDGKVVEINTKDGEQVAPDKELIKIEKITD
jgi:biotin carboxyl carrier protein